MFLAPSSPQTVPRPNRDCLASTRSAVMPRGRRYAPSLRASSGPASTGPRRAASRRPGPPPGGAGVLRSARASAELTVLTFITEAETARS
jgi:hypothetical protein